MRYMVIYCIMPRFVYVINRSLVTPLAYVMFQLTKKNPENRREAGQRERDLSGHLDQKFWASAASSFSHPARHLHPVRFTLV